VFEEAPLTKATGGGAPFLFAARGPTATSIDDDIYLTVAAAAPDSPNEFEEIDIILSVEYAQQAIAQLSAALIAARQNEAS
jgi:hypothetical protein